MGEKKFTYTANKINQPQKIGNIRIDPKGGEITEREYKALKKDAYGASLIEKGMLVFEESKSDSAPAASGANTGDEIPDFERH